jgi:ADP-ribose pyrophosphatase YjhB (NUDIX family)
MSGYVRGKKFCAYCGARLTERVLEERTRGYCTGCGSICYENPVPAVAALVMNHHGRLLLVKRGVEPAKGMWCLPGGFIEIDESIEEAVLRELEEETGIRGKIDGLIDFFSQQSPHYGAILLFGYTVTMVGGTVRPGFDAEEVAFFNRDALPPIAFFSHQKLIDKVIRNRQ